MNLKHQQEANQQGMKLLSDRGIDSGLTSNYKKYRFISCNHEGFFQPQHVRRGNVVCNECLEAQLVVDAEKSGYTYLGAAKEQHGKASIYFRSYKNNQCGCVSDIRYAGIRGKSTQRCTTCYENGLKKIALDVGLVYLGLSDSNGIFRKFQYQECGHTQDIAASCISLGTFECKICLEDSYLKEAENEGLTLLPFCNCSHGYRQYQLPCGCNRSLRIANVRNGAWACVNHGETHLVRPSNLYLLEIRTATNSWLKLGFAKNIHNRINMYGLPSETSVNIVFTLPTDSGYVALEKEKQIHRQLRGFRIKPSLMKTYMQNGHTECYPCEQKEHILKILKAHV